jgi:O-antigen ligase
MMAAYALAPVFPARAMGRRARIPFVKQSLIQILVCVLPSMLAVGLDRPRVAAIYFLSTLFSLQLYCIMRRNPLGATTLAVGTLPAWMLLRDYFYYTAIEVVLGICVLAWIEGRRSDFRAVSRDRLVQCFAALIAIYWLIAFCLTSDYSANLRGFELLFSAMNVRLLGRHRRWFATALMGVAISVVGMGCGLLPYADRLGMASLMGTRVGNPISFGVPAALALLASVTDGGRWMLMHSRPWLRIAMDLVIGVFLVLSTSRGSWLVLAVGMTIIFVLSHRQRALIFSVLLLLILGGVLYVHFDNDNLVRNYMRETFSPEESWSKRTTGRAEQWAAFPRVIHDSPVWGFGPGNGRRISVLYAHKNIIWHSTYLQVGAETGLIGLSLLALLLGAIIRRAWLHYRRVGEIMPLIGIAGFMTIGMSVPGFDGLSGMFLGLALCACDFSRIYRVRWVSTAANHLAASPAEMPLPPAIHAARVEAAGAGGPRPTTSGYLPPSAQ